MEASVLTSFIQRIEYEVLSFTNLKDTIKYANFRKCIMWLRARVL